jgi:hypothetical protein
MEETKHTIGIKLGTFIVELKSGGSEDMVVNG